jgi:hypothetical protein
MRDMHRHARTVLFRFSTSGQPHAAVSALERWLMFRTAVFHWMNMSVRGVLYPRNSVVYYMYPRNSALIDTRCAPCVGFVDGTVVDAALGMAEWASSIFVQARVHWGWTLFTESDDIFPEETHIDSDMGHQQ